MSQDARGAAPDDNYGGLVGVGCFDFMLIELVPMAERLTEEIHTHNQTKIGNADNPSKLTDEKRRETIYYRLENLGYRVGQGITESLTMHHPLPTPRDPLDTIKYLCKNIWTAVFRKQVDNLKTNHRGTFVLTDNHFYPLMRCSLPALPKPERSSKPDGTAESDEEYQKRTEENQRRVVDTTRTKAAPFLYFPSGIVRGALSALGMEASVIADVGTNGAPLAVFQIKTVGAK